MQRRRKAKYLILQDAGEASDVACNLAVICGQVFAKVLSGYVWFMTLNASPIICKVWTNTDLVGHEKK
jgi:hypothetical protein